MSRAPESKTTLELGDIVVYAEQASDGVDFAPRFIGSIGVVVAIAEMGHTTHVRWFSTGTEIPKHDVSRHFTANLLKVGHINGQES